MSCDAIDQPVPSALLSSLLALDTVYSVLAVRCERQNFIDWRTVCEE